MLLSLMVESRPSYGIPCQSNIYIVQKLSEPIREEGERRKQRENTISKTKLTEHRKMRTISSHLDVKRCEIKRDREREYK